MKKEPQGTICFELSGASLEAALTLEAEIKKELGTVPVKKTGNGLEIQESWNNFYAGLLRRLAREKPEALAQGGLNSPSVQVMQGKDSLPRAYRCFPEIFSSPEKEPRYFMYAPVSHDGEYFAPEGATRLHGKREADVGELLFAGGWLGNAPLISTKKTGVSLPADYAPETMPALKKAFNEDTRTWRCFVAGGESLAAVEDFDRRTRDYRAAVEKARKLIQSLAEETFPDLLKTLPPGEALRAQVSYSYGGYLDGKTEIRLSVRQEGKVNLWDAGKTVPVTDGKHYALEDTGYGEYTVSAKNATPEGRLLGALLAAIPPTPALADYPELRGNFDFEPNKIEAMLGVNGLVPQARVFGPHTVLVYNSDDAVKSDFCPPGAKPLPTAAYLWLQADEGDRCMGVTPPPMPPEVSTLLGAFSKTTPPAPKL